MRAQGRVRACQLPSSIFPVAGAGTRGASHQHAAGNTELDPKRKSWYVQGFDKIGEYVVCFPRIAMLPLPSSPSGFLPVISSEARRGKVWYVHVAERNLDC